MNRVGLLALVTCCALCLAAVTVQADEPTSRAKPARKGRQQEKAQPWDPVRAQQEYSLIEAELALSKSEKPYMVLNLQKNQLELRLKGAVVWAYPMDVAEADSEGMAGFADHFVGDGSELVRFISQKHLFAARDKTPDSVLAIVGGVVKANPELLQRDVPARFQLMWGPGLVLEVRTDVDGQPLSRFRNTTVMVRDVLRKPFGEARITVKMQADAALTLYRVSLPGMPTMIYPRPKPPKQ